jgi:ribosomal protein S24E
MITDRINIKDGELTFGQRISLGELFSSEKSEMEKFEETFLILHNQKPDPKDYKKLVGYFSEIMDGLKFWVEQEATLLKYEPTPEEIKAGIRDLSKEIGEFGTVKALAKAYHVDPDVIFTWKYGKVFGILYTDLREHMYSRRFQKVLESKK